MKSVQHLTCIKFTVIDEADRIFSSTLVDETTAILPSRLHRWLSWPKLGLYSTIEVNDVGGLTICRRSMAWRYAGDQQPI